MKVVDALFKAACDAHVKGMGHTKRSARIEQAASILSEDGAHRLLQGLLRSGVIEANDCGDGYVIVDEVSRERDEVHDIVSKAMNAKGGKA